YNTPLPAKYVEPLLDAVRPTAAERDRFLALYHEAHHMAGKRAGRPATEKARVLRIELPRLGSTSLERRVDTLVQELARQVSARGRPGSFASNGHGWVPGRSHGGSIPWCRNLPGQSAIWWSASPIDPGARCQTSQFTAPEPARKLNLPGWVP